jgi:hypothetical protein
MIVSPPLAGMIIPAPALRASWRAVVPRHDSGSHLEAEQKF